MITIFQHGPGETPGYILEIIENKALEYEIIRLFAGDKVPEQVTRSHYIFLGGLMSVNDEVQYPYLVREKKLIRQAILAGVPVLGICLGAQLIASAFSAKVGPCAEEKGWTAIRKCDRPRSGKPEDNSGKPGEDRRRGSEEIMVFEWHGECFDLPPGSSLIYTGDRVTNQMFAYGSAIGVQFHPEVTESIIRQWADSGELPFRHEIIRAIPLHIAGSNEICREIMDRFIGKVG